jgi:predicted oxidoreductase
MTHNKNIILGCMGFGGGWNENPISKEDEIQAQQTIETALELGIKKFDHADIYTFGKAEEVFGRILQKDPSLRSKMSIQTKAGIMLGKGHNGSNIYNNSKEYIINQVQASIKRLHIDYLDSFLIHRPDPLLDGEEIAETFDFLKKSGLVKTFGVSNMSVEQIKYIQKYWEEPLIANQIQFSLGHSSLIDMGVHVNTENIKYDSGLSGMLEYCKTNKMTIQAWGSLDGGRFSGKAAPTLTKNDEDTISLVNKLSGKYEVSTSAIVLAWILALPISIHPIIGTINSSRIKDCNEALTIQLNREDWYDLWIAAKGVSLP